MLSYLPPIYTIKKKNSIYPFFVHIQKALDNCQREPMNEKYPFPSLEPIKKTIDDYQRESDKWRPTLPRFTPYERNLSCPSFDPI